MKKQKITLVLGMLCLLVVSSYGQEPISLSTKLQSKKIKAVTKTIIPYEGHLDAVEMLAKDGDGLGILEDLPFEKGTIEVELLGENNPGRSFIGIAFNIQDDDTYEAVYLRPFNFVAKEQIRKEHMMQYIFHPEFTWKKLREERTGEFEAEITNPPNPDDWFKVKITINDKRVMVYVNEMSEPTLTVDRLTVMKTDKIGIWTGFGSSGRFRNLVVRPSNP